MRDQERDAIRWALARHLAGMRETHDHSRYEPSATYVKVDGKLVPAHLSADKWVPCPGYQPLPLANGEIDVGRLIKAIQKQEEFFIDFDCAEDHPYLWGIYPDMYVGIPLAEDPDLAVAYLKARQDWPLKEEN